VEKGKIGGVFKRREIQHHHKNKKDKLNTGKGPRKNRSMGVNEKRVPVSGP